MPGAPPPVLNVLRHLRLVSEPTAAIRDENANVYLKVPKNETTTVGRAENRFSVRLVTGLVVWLPSLLLLFLFRDSVKNVLLWAESQNPFVVYVSCVALYAFLAFPFAFGYVVVNVAAGYLFGVVAGTAVTGTSVAIGLVVGHAVMQRCMKNAMREVLREWRNEGEARDCKGTARTTFAALLQAISGPRAWKVVLFTRLTPLPFGIQNAIFSTVDLNMSQYVGASALGLFPTQVLNVWLGSTLRSMKEVVNLGDSNLLTPAWIACILTQVLISVLLVIALLKIAQSQLNEAEDVELGLRNAVTKKILEL